MPGSAETLPAGFRLTATSGHSRRLPPEGKRPLRRGDAHDRRRGFQTATPVSRSLRAAQSCTRRRTTVPTTRIWTGFKVSHAPPPKPPPSHGLCQPLSRVCAPLPLPTAHEPTRGGVAELRQGRAVVAPAVKSEGVRLRTRSHARRRNPRGGNETRRQGGRAARGPPSGGSGRERSVRGKLGRLPSWLSRLMQRGGWQQSAVQGQILV